MPSSSASIMASMTDPNAHIVLPEIVTEARRVGRIGITTAGVVRPDRLSRRGEIEPESRVARHRPGRVARQHIDFAGLQGGKPVLGRQRHKFYFRRIVEDCCRNSTAVVDIESGPIALRIGHPEAGQHAVRAAS
jgi:hypothetical protein